ncbi:RNA polymerase sigma factor [Nocardioides panaciterrulae]|uniref:RNA polymerase sigma-70 factor (ECF subfamily) n=1 Tax=Nocardioides panaciterrulae TaxID=661492 RepID=A0A7Y9JBQ0_9ACTN|nr:sigma-70 family RNA polymerase sigma factor [Nocardioides panaciterrulae]NYD42593.1 RNA polymerase sigma-70 factor (ECF subfamily) [Nocardioides panaciterrulae]
MSDDDLVARAKAGDAQAWRELYRTHAGRLVVWLGVRPSEDAAISSEDLAAEAWLTAAQKIHGFTGTSSDFAGWLFGIARNLSTNSTRRSRRRLTEPVPELPDREHAEGPEPALVARDWVEFALRGLPPRERDVIACTEVVGLDVESTARALDISAVAVRVARHRALKRLRAKDSAPAQASTPISRSR